MFQLLSIYFKLDKSKVLTRRWLKKELMNEKKKQNFSSRYF